MEPIQKALRPHLDSCQEDILEASLKSKFCSLDRIGFRFSCRNQIYPTATQGNRKLKGCEEKLIS